MKRFRVVLCAGVVLFFCRVVPAQTIEVNEKTARLLLRDGQGSKLVLPVKNFLPQSVEATLQVEVVDIKGAIQEKLQKEEVLAAGESSITLALPFAQRT